MSTVEDIEQAIRALARDDLAKLRNWFAQFDATAWDAQIEMDAAAGRLDALAAEAVEEYRQGKAGEL